MVYNVSPSEVKGEPNSPKPIKKQSATFIKKDLKHIKNAGASAEGLGWVLILGSGFLAWDAKFRAVMIVAYIFYLFAGCSLLYLGKYIRFGLGRKIKGALLANGIIAIPFCTGVIPIVVSVLSFMSYARFKKLSIKTQHSYSKPKPYKISILDIVLGILCIAVSAISFSYKYSHFDTAFISFGNSSVSDQSAVYTAPKHDFAIYYPGTPRATDFTSRISGYTIQHTTYTSSINNDTQVFDVYAYSWPTQGFNFSGMSQATLRTTLSEALHNLVKAMPGTINSSEQSSFSGYTDEEAQFTVIISGNKDTGYARLFFIGNNQYGILSIGSSRADFESFANSFRYIGH